MLFYPRVKICVELEKTSAEEKSTDSFMRDFNFKPCLTKVDTNGEEKKQHELGYSFRC